MAPPVLVSGAAQKVDDWRRRLLRWLLATFGAAALVLVARRLLRLTVTDGDQIQIKQYIPMGVEDEEGEEGSPQKEPTTEEPPQP